MNRRTDLGLIVDRPEKAKSHANKDIRRKANPIANTVKVNNCEIVKSSKGKTSIVTHKVKGNQMEMEVVVPAQVPTDKLAFHTGKLSRGFKKVKIETVGYRKRRKKSAHICKQCKYTNLALKLKKGDDDGSGTGGRRGKIRRKKKLWRE